MLFSEQFDASVNSDVQRAIVDIVIAEYRHTHAEVWRRYEPGEAIEVEPHVRRANIETALLELPNRFPGVVELGSGRTQRGHHYRYIKCGNIVSTQSYVEADRRVPREAAFRNEFAGNPNQMFLDPAAEAERIKMLRDRELIYTIITHTPSVNALSEPSHVSVVLVDAKCHHVSSINLIEHLAKRVVAVVPSETAEDRRIPALRKDVAQKNTGA